MVDLQRLELLEQPAQRADRGEPYFRVGRPRIPSRERCIFHIVKK